MEDGKMFRILIVGVPQENLHILGKLNKPQGKIT